MFGDGIVGRDLLNGDVVSATYTTSSGSGANGLLQFENIGTFINDEQQSVTSGITISLIERPEGGKDAETTEAIKFSAQNSILRSVEQFLRKIMKQLFQIFTQM